MLTSNPSQENVALGLPYERVTCEAIPVRAVFFLLKSGLAMIVDILLKFSNLIINPPRHEINMTFLQQMSLDVCVLISWIY